jgi:hypothetical protein
MGPMVFVLVSMLSTSFIAHYNAPKFYQVRVWVLVCVGVCGFVCVRSSVTGGGRWKEAFCSRVKFTSFVRRVCRLPYK